MHYCQTSKITSSYIVHNDSNIIAFNLKHSLIIVIFSKIYFRNKYCAHIFVRYIFRQVKLSKICLISLLVLKVKFLY